MNRRLGLPLLRIPERLQIVRPFGGDAERYSRFGLAGHNGVDFAAEEDELVVAVDDGEVIEVRFDPSGYGTTVKLAHEWGESRYAHGLRLSVPIEFRLGHIVRRGERVMVAAGPHLHFGLRLRRKDGSLEYGNGGGFGGYEDPLPHLGLAAPAPAPAAPMGKGRR